jgi:membrane fusion protein, multidrug efflux system
VAPFDGVLSKRYKSDGEYVAIGAAVFELSNNTDLEVSLKVPESLLPKVRVGQDLEVTIPSLGTTLSLKIDRLVPIVAEASRTFEVLGRFPTLPKGAAPGQFVEAKFDSL